MIRSRAVRGAPAVLAVLAVALGSCSADPDSTGSSDRGSASGTETATARPTSTVFDPDEPTLPGGVRVLSRAVDDFVPVAGGRYGVRVSDSLLYQVDVPDGSEVFGGYALNPYSEGATTRGAILWMEVADEGTALPKDPCHDHTYRRVGSTVEDLATALSNQPFLDVTKPVKTTVGGKNGLFVKATVPKDAKLSTCQNGNVTIIDADWEEPGIVERMWIFDVDGTRHILKAVVFPDPGATKHVPTLNRMVESITFTHS